MQSLEADHKITPEDVSKEPTKQAGEVLIGFVEQAVSNLRQYVKEGSGRQVVGEVQGRPEDEELKIDTIGEGILTELIKNARLRAFVFGEHNNYDLTDGINSPDVYFFIDPFDNSSEYKRGLPTPVFTVASAYNPDGWLIGAVIGDITNAVIYVAIGGETYMKDLESGRQWSTRKAERTSFSDPETCLASYLGSNQYSLPFFDRLRPLIEKMHPKARIFPNGGAFIYGPLGVGAVDAYVMFNEPHSEILPGLPFALAAGCEAISVDPVTGEFESYTVNPALLKKNPDVYNEGSVPFFIAVANPKIRDEIISCYLAAKNAY